MSKELLKALNTPQSQQPSRNSAKIMVELSAPSTSTVSENDDDKHTIQPVQYMFPEIKVKDEIELGEPSFSVQSIPTTDDEAHKDQTITEIKVENEDEMDTKIEDEMEFCVLSPVVAQSISKTDDQTFQKASTEIKVENEMQIDSFNTAMADQPNVAKIGRQNMILIFGMLNGIVGGFTKIVDGFYSDAIKRRQRERKRCLQRIRNIRRQQILLLTSCLNHKIWKQERTGNFWELACRINDDKFFKKNFRVDRRTFAMLCKRLRVLEKIKINCRETIPLEKRIGITLYALGSSSKYRTIGNLFGVGKSSVASILLEFCQAVWNELAPVYLNSFPLTRETIKESVTGFEKLGFPQCLGAVDGCHIEVYPSPAEAINYCNCEGWCSTILLALVDYRHRFLYINIGNPGRCNDSFVFEKSQLKIQLNNCNLLEEMSRPMGATRVPVGIIGDSAFRLSNRLMKPFPLSLESNEEIKNFNYVLSKTRMVAEKAFGQLKARFRRIGKGMDNHMKNVNTIVKACCVLHNLCNEHNDSIPKKWIKIQEREETREVPSYENVEGSEDYRADAIRRAIASFLGEHFVLVPFPTLFPTKCKRNSVKIG